MDCITWCPFDLNIKKNKTNPKLISQVSFQATGQQHNSPLLASSPAAADCRGSFLKPSVFSFTGTGSSLEFVCACTCVFSLLASEPPQSLQLLLKHSSSALACLLLLGGKALKLWEGRTVSLCQPVFWGRFPTGVNSYESTLLKLRIQAFDLHVPAVAVLACSITFITVPFNSIWALLWHCDLA